MGRKTKNCVGQLPLIQPESPWRPPSLTDLPSWDGIKRIGLDTEGRDPMLKKLGPGVRRKDSYTVGISFAFEDGPSFYLPFRHKGGDNLDEKHVLQYMKDQAKIFTGAICGANLQYDLDFLAEEGIVFKQATFKDIQIAEPLIDENKFSYSLQNISEQYGFQGKDETLLREVAKAYGIDPKADLWRLPARYVGGYAEVDAELPLKILRKQERILEDQDLWPIYELECQVLPVLVKMRRRGVRIDFDQLERVEEVTMEKETQFLQIIYDKTGVRINMDEINKTKLVVKACDVAQIPYGRTAPSKTYPDGQPSVKREFLEPNAAHPVVNAILEARSYNKIRNTFVESIRKHETNGRIHCTFNQLRRQDDNSDVVKGAGPGRLSCVPKATSEILTKRGWLSWNQLRIGEPVMGYNILTDQYQWTPLKAVHDAGVAPVGTIKATRGRGSPGPNSLPQGFLCTKEHKWIIRHSKISGFTKAGDNVRKFRKLLTPQTKMPASNNSLLTDDQAFVLGWYLTDGWLRKSQRMIRRSMCVAVVKKSSINQLKSKIGEYGLENHTTYHTYLKMLPGQDHKRNVHYFYFKASYFDCIYKLIEGKDPAEIVLALSSSARKAMLSAMLEGDGSRRRGAQRFDRFGALEDHNKHTWEFFTILAVACGQPLSVSRTITRQGKNFLNFQLLSDEVWADKNHKWTPTHEADTWCPETELGTWVMRQGKRICVTGNSCSPNLQQQPSRHPILGKMWRSIYLPDEGGKWASLDYSQQEPRLFVHFAHICGCPGTQAAVNGFEQGYDWHDMTTEMAFGIRKIDDPVLFKLMRKKAKAVFLGLTYGMGQAKMCRSCGFSIEKIHIRGAQREVAGPEGRAFLEEFNRKVPFLRDIKERVERVAWNRRYIRTILGRHIHYPPARNMERKALNNLIQGSAADQTKLAMVLLDKENYKIQLQIHDEIAITVYSESTAKDMAEIMTTCVPLVVPSKVDIEIGANWGDSME